MALTDKNIIITPNIGSSTDDPKIVFSGADASTSAQNITLKVYPTLNGTLSFEGTAGQLFSISNTATGTIYSVNDISGIPSIEVLDTGLVKLAQYGGSVAIGSNTAVISSINTTPSSTFAKTYNWLAVTDSNYVQRCNNTDGSVFQFLRGPTTVGSISVTSSATSYTTSSDYRLKTDVEPMQGALNRLMGLKPVTYTWKNDGLPGEGFIAHELAEVCPQAVSGKKDDVDDQGNPVYQGVDTSFLIGMMVSAIQELQQKIVSLEQQIVDLSLKQ